MTAPRPDRLLCPLAAALALAAVASACVPNTGDEQRLRTEAPGTYSATTDEGAKLDLVLRADGTGQVNGHEGTWEVKFDRLFLSDGERTAPADLENGQLTVHTTEGPIVFTRVGGPREKAVAAAPAASQQPAGPAPAAGPPAELAPSRVLPATPTVVTEPAAAGITIAVPDGWTTGPAHDARLGDGLLLTAPAGAGAGAIVVARRDLPADRGDGPASALLRDLLGLAMGQVQLETVLAPEDVTVVGARAGRAIVRGSVDGAAREAYLGAVVIPPHIYLVGAIYDPARADDMRVAVETVLASVRAAQPPDPTKSSEPSGP